ncbi:ricin-type beta-trefoil lectin domain protein [Streptomyces sp. NPDC096012]|uniref:ricin-type beta-trefoil lectin domain protein n=1 Tax=Streptomyces sp. NPDC096012 TaxID=3155684 RepID=UPI003369F62E
MSDEQLSAELKKWTGTAPALHPVGELLDRHWEPALAYARLCTDGPHAAGILTTATFTRLFGESLRHNGPTAAWRPEVLVTVRRIAAEWETGERRELLHPRLRTGDGTGERAAARLLPPPERRLLTRAFQRVPATSRAVLWHIEVETEPPAVPAVLLGLDEEGVGVELQRARERLREECLQAHRELAPDAECRRYLRMLDVTFRRGAVDIDPDLSRHLAGCPHCSRTAEQLARFNSGLGTALAEAVLGWGAHAYVESRVSRAEAPAEPPPAPAAVVPVAGEAFAFTGTRAAGDPARPAGPPDSAAPRRSGHRAGPAAGRRSAQRAEPASGRSGRGAEPASGPSGREATSASGPSGREATSASGPSGREATSASGPSGQRAEPGPGRAGQRAESAASRRSSRGTRPAAGRSAQRAARRVRRRNLALAVVTVGGLVALPLVLWSVLGSGDAPSSGPGGGSTPAPGKVSASPGASWAGTGGPQGALHGRLRNLASGLCVGIVGGKAVRGAETELTGCSAAPSRQWTYETDGLLRNAAAPDLCLDSRLGYSVRLAPCTATGSAARSIRYDFTLQGALIPRWNQELALTPAATDGSGALVLKLRATGAAQRWSVDPAEADLEMQNVNWGGDRALSPPPAAASAGTGASPVPEASRPAPTASRSAPAPDPAPTATGPTSAPPATVPPCAAHPYHCGGGRRHR